MSNDIKFSTLFLGDSYTIGELVPLYANYPYQTIQLLRQEGFGFYAPEIIAKTGWTTDELSAQIANTTFLKSYDFVCLLIGVNNQYRGRDVENFQIEFEALLQKAIFFANGIAANVTVLSIPDWGVTPFAEGKDRNKIALEIDAYNAVCKTLADKNGCAYIDITDSQRSDGNKSEFLAPDLLHPGELEYKKWALLVADRITSLLAP